MIPATRFTSWEQLPDLAQGQVIEKLEFQDRMRYQMCSKKSQYIHEKEASMQLHEIFLYIDWRDEYAQVKIKPDKEKEYEKEVFYVPDESNKARHCKVLKSRTEKDRKNPITRWTHMSYYHRAIMDIGSIIVNKRLKVNEFRVMLGFGNFEITEKKWTKNMTELIEKAWKTDCPNGINAKLFSFTYNQSCEKSIARMLGLIRPKSLECFCMSHASESKTELNMKRIANMEQWKYAYRFHVTANITPLHVLNENRFVSSHGFGNPKIDIIKTIEALRQVEKLELVTLRFQYRFSTLPKGFKFEEFIPDGDNIEPVKRLPDPSEGFYRFYRTNRSTHFLRLLFLDNVGGPSTFGPIRRIFIEPISEPMRIIQKI